MTLDRATILQARDFTFETVPVPEWGGDIMVRTMTNKEREALDDWYLSKDGEKNLKGFRALLAASTVCDDTGALLFTPDDIPALEQKSFAAMQRVYQASAALNKLRAQDQEELVKNSDAGSDDDSPSG
jgi:hypothetical protein